MSFSAVYLSLCVINEDSGYILRTEASFEANSKQILSGLMSLWMTPILCRRSKQFKILRGVPQGGTASP